MNFFNRIKLLGASATLLTISALGQTPAPPPQPAFGPGGKTYPHAAIVTNGPYWANNLTNQDKYRYFIFEPASPTPAQAPVILFLHGILANDPVSYAYWIDHMVLKGYTVVWVQFQAGLTATSQYEVNARKAWADALNRLQNYWWEDHVPPALSSNGQPETMIVGHSVGAFTAANLAATVKTAAPVIPVPYGLVLIEPGSKSLVKAENFGAINPNTPVVMVGGDDDTIVCNYTEDQIWNAIGQIPASLKNYLWVQTDTHGSPQQLASHYFPNTTGYSDTAAVDNRDFNVTWKLSVALADCVFGNTTNDPYACTIALGQGNSLQTNMGSWSDGTPVKPMIYYSNPNTIPNVPKCIP